MKLLTKARKQGKIKVEPPIFGNLISSFEAIEESNRKILNYGWVNFPFAYTQVSTLSVYLYFFALLFGRQYLTPNEPEWKTPGDIYHIKNSNFTSIFYRVSPLNMILLASTQYLVLK